MDRTGTLADRLAVYLVADPSQSPKPLDQVVAAALRGGVTTVQLRAKSSTDRAQVDMARTLNDLCRQAGALFIVNDRVDVALAIGAHGVHLGVDDIRLEDARRVLGPESLIGYSPETDDQAASARDRGAVYLGVGPVFGTASKSDAGAAIGIESLRRRAELAAIPVIGIGGITPSNAASVITAGAIGVAVISAILRADDPQRAAAELASVVDTAVESR